MIQPLEISYDSFRKRTLLETNSILFLIDASSVRSQNIFAGEKHFYRGSSIFSPRIRKLFSFSFSKLLPFSYTHFYTTYAIHTIQLQSLRLLLTTSTSLSLFFNFRTYRLKNLHRFLSIIFTSYEINTNCF